MSAVRHCLGQRLRTLLFATVALALVNQSVFGLGCLPCSEEAGRDVAAVALITGTAQADAPDSQPGDDCGACCDVLPPGHCYGQAASMPLSLALWQPGAPPRFETGANPTADPPFLLTERFRPPIR
jgi:hypothetical protein